jgi:hypothetical protein
MTARVLLALSLLAPATSFGQDGPPAKDDFKEKTVKHKKDVTRLRGLEFKGDVTVGAYSKDELVAFLKAEFEKDLPKEKAERFQRAYAKFGLIPGDLDIHEAYMELFGSSIAGFYHPKTKELRLIKPGGEEGLEEKAAKLAGIDMEAITLVHELTHAAQDQNFELSTLPLEDETNDDLILALKSAIEGDASAVGWKYQFKEQFDGVIGMINQQYKGGQLPGKANKLPAYLKLSLTFPYGHGTDFIVQTLKGTQGELKDVTKIFKDLPISSEQILHPTKYYEDRDHPTLVLLDAEKVVGGGWKESFNNVHGEFGVKVLLREFRGDKLRLPVVDKASAGWDGDRYVILEDGKKNTAYVWATTWDSEDDAKEFIEAYAWALEKKHKLPVGEKDVEDRVEIPEADALLERKGADVLVIEGLPADLRKKSDALWRAVKKSEMSGFERLKKFVCEKHKVKEAFSGKCPTCGEPLKYMDEEGKPPEKKRREFSPK